MTELLPVERLELQKQDNDPKETDEEHGYAIVHQAPSIDDDELSENHPWHMQEETLANNLRAILPRAPDEQHSPQITQSERRIKRVTAACELCRQRRVKVHLQRELCFR